MISKDFIASFLSFCSQNVISTFSVDRIMFAFFGAVFEPLALTFALFFCCCYRVLWQGTIFVQYENWQTGVCQCITAVKSVTEYSRNVADLWKRKLGRAKLNRNFG